VIGFAIAWTQILKGHIQVDFIVMKIPDRPRAVIDAIMTLFGIAFFILLAWQTWKYAMSIQASGEVSMTQGIQFFPFIYALAVCYFVTILVLVVDFLKTILKAGKAWNL
jgi:TRAP-type C4-dicarboxylate transport system permease small subunit